MSVRTWLVQGSALLVLLPSALVYRLKTPPGKESLSTWMLVTFTLITALLAFALRRRLSAMLAPWAVAASIVLASIALVALNRYSALLDSCIVPFSRAGSDKIELVYFPLHPTGQLAELIRRQRGSKRGALVYGIDTVNDTLTAEEQQPPLASTTRQFMLLRVAASVLSMLAAAIVWCRFIRPLAGTKAPDDPVATPILSPLPDVAASRVGNEAPVEAVAATPDVTGPIEPGKKHGACDLQRLTPEEILTVHDAAMRLGLAPSRDALLAGMPATFKGSLPTEKIPSAQILSDLGALNRAERLADGTDPLATWLQIAVNFTNVYPDGQIFRVSLEKITKQKQS